MVKYKYEKIKNTNNKKSYLFACKTKSVHNLPVIEYDSSLNATKLGIIDKKNNYLCALEILSKDGSEYSIKQYEESKLCAFILVYNKCLYFGSQIISGSLNGMVYCLENNQPIKLQMYKHGMLENEIISDIIVDEDIIYNLPFDGDIDIDEVKNYELEEDISYINGNIPQIGARLLKNNHIIVGQFNNKTLDGIGLDYGKEDNTYTFGLFSNGINNQNFKINYIPEIKGYSLMVKKKKEGYLNFIYYLKDGKYLLLKQDLNDNQFPLFNSSVELRDDFDCIQNKKIKKISGGMEKLNNLVGLENIKDEIIKLKAIIKKNPNKTPNLNMVFYGNPGTGKTEVARLFADILYEEKILPTNKIIETDRSGLVADYVGQTMIKTHNKVRDAMGGVLFIDEAYSLFSNDQNDFGKEALDALVTDMENYRGDICFIFAGYKMPILDMLEVNKGLKSRINRYFEFNNYTITELEEIARKKLMADGYIINDDALSKIMRIVKRAMIKEDFANAREVRNIIESIYEIQAIRTIDDTANMLITLEDVEDYDNQNRKVSSTLAYDELNSLVGLDNVKRELDRMRALLIKNKGDMERTNLHMCFLGNPGTGKTKVARLVARILYEEGILPDNKYIEVSRNGLVAGFVGQTAIKTHKAVKRALGGVLFIDEAYSLINDSSNDFGLEAVDTLLVDMDNYRGQICIIFAGYEQQMEKFLSSNPGLRSRINLTINFEDYSDDELMEIALRMIDTKKYILSDGAKDTLKILINILKRQKDFANARTIRNALESIYAIQALRTNEEHIPDDLRITANDIFVYLKDHNLGISKPIIPKFNLRVIDFIRLSNAYIDAKFNFTTDYIRQSSVNIKVLNNFHPISEGSGCFITKDGLIITCAHLFSECDTINVIVNFKMFNGEYITKEYAATLVYKEKLYDLALLKIDDDNVSFSYYPLTKIDANYDDVTTAIAMGGYPFGGSRFESISINEGTIQSFNKDKYQDNEIINMYVDIAGQPGSSGSGIINKQNGRLLGIFAGVSIFHNNGRERTINYAIPTKYIWDMLKDASDVNNTYSSELTTNSYILGNKNINSEVVTTVEEETIPTYSADEISYINNEYGKQNIAYRKIKIELGNILTYKGDAIVNVIHQYNKIPNDEELQLFKKAGYKQLLYEYSKLEEIKVAASKLTLACNLDNKYIIHAVAPNYEETKNPVNLLETMYENIFNNCISHNIKTLGISILDNNIYKFDDQLSINILFKELIKYLNHFKEIKIYTSKEYDFYLVNVLYNKIKN